MTSESVVSFGNGHNSISDKKMDLRESPGESTRQRDSFASPKNKATTSPESEKILGAKRPLTNNSPASPGVANGHLVYVRRKLETDQAKASNSNTAACADVKKISRDDLKQQNGDQKLIDESKLDPKSTDGPSLLASPIASQQAQQHISTEQPLTESGQLESHVPSVKTAVAHSSDSHVPGDEDHKERFFRLQKFLKSSDQSSQEDYIQMLRSLSAADRSKHAAELEKRVVRLLLEEERELQKMKALNVFGKSSPND